MAVNQVCLTSAQHTLCACYYINDVLTNVENDNMNRGGGSPLSKPCEFTQSIAFSFILGRVNPLKWPTAEFLGPKVRDCNLVTFWKILDYTVSEDPHCNVNINTVNSLASHDAAL